MDRSPDLLTMSPAIYRLSYPDSVRNFGDTTQISKAKEAKW